MLNFAATFSEVMPIGVRHAAAFGSAKVSLMLNGGMVDGSPGAPPLVMCSTPPAIPTSIIPVAMEPAMVAILADPLEHCLFKVMHPAVSGIPALRAAVLAGKLNAPGVWVFPMTTSWISAGLILVSFKIPLKTATSKSSGMVSLNPPLRALQIGVRRADTMTTSLSFLDPTWPKTPLCLPLVSQVKMDCFAVSPPF